MERPTITIRSGEKTALKAWLDDFEANVTSKGWDVARHDDTYLEVSKTFEEGTDKEWEANFHYHIV